MNDKEFMAKSEMAVGRGNLQLILSGQGPTTLTAQIGHLTK